MEGAQREPVVKAPAVVVVVVKQNGDDDLRGCLATLVRQSFTDFETIVIDNASRVGSLSRVGEQPARRTIPRQDGNLGFAAASNVRSRGRRCLALVRPEAETSPE